jgi:hypothetical protein
MNPSDQARQVGIVNSWLAQHEQSGAVATPTAGQVILDSGQLPAGYYDVTFFIGVSATTAWNDLTLEHRDATNAVSISSQGILSPAMTTILLTYLNIKVATNERFRLISNGNLGYNVWGTDVIIRRA